MDPIWWKTRKNVFDELSGEYKVCMPEVALEDDLKRLDVSDVVTPVAERTSCQMCGVGFEDVQGQREHFKSDWHRLNLKMSARGKPAMNEEEAGKFLEADDVESLSGSDDSDDSNEDGETDKAFVASKSGRTGVILQGEERKIGWVASGVVLDREGDTLDIVSLLERHVWVILLYKAGHFAGVVLEKSKKVLASKSFHRYVIRAKQGKSQSANDNSSGKAVSAGAQIRRYNEAKLGDEVHELLSSWEVYLKKASRVFVSVSKTNQKLFFGDEKLLSSKDARIRRVPFPTKRPTVKEATMIGMRLAEVKIELEEVYLARKRAKAATRAPPSPPKKRAEKCTIEEEVVETEKVIEEDPEDYASMLKSCIDGDSGAVEASLNANPSLLMQPSVKHDGCIPLHIAALHGQAEIVRLLLNRGADPCTRDHRGRLPFNCATSSKPTRDAFRRFRGDFPDKYDYEKACVPGPLTAEKDELKKQKQREKKKRQAEKKKRLKQEERLREEAAKLKKEKEDAAILAAAHSCESCRKKLLGNPSKWFQRLDYYYCSLECMHRHRRQLAADAAESRRT
uniref:VLRF1 domain-containing protein n=1 Tax=Mucochytrium quahogii TaxID=96639 RepID=A0A7S2WHB4_9STRA|mmetsp:Transcript_37709/g.61386  ORF Transcript_37709/g.61386 Transcript_37709/m.61386 type:complete len:566 (+) Transcript_37709:151-1848(+)|eukprot:CAMPEP_0203755304 /NCGR_PEP_ID=MMETSP0098-20131031/8772_1 /ASSEMBLY_ACC=CAM_ASM_000208 /TAXON_ID=96639 /ORGANISM=" , Strain NY0313808BC1" /LENGTH=565 /DNA_ID=CAMNT_0050646705 /DNA_START=124 /DNA_END=1821 /DNA_ORIENTATION=-